MYSFFHIQANISHPPAYGTIITEILKKMTSPDEKVLVIELSEKQISGRTVSMSINYEDILAADSFSTLLLNEE